jgi:nucleoid-associated protein EbfC
VFPDGFDLEALFQQGQQVQMQIYEAQRELAEQRLTGTAGGGLVTATVTGVGELVGLEISPEAADPQDTETLADLIIAAINAAQVEVKKLEEEKLAPFQGLLGGLGPGGGMPGF